MKICRCYTAFSIIAMISFFATSLYAQEDRDIRQEFLQELITLQEQPSSKDDFVSHHDKTWEGWVKRTGELPPNFEKMPSIALLPDPLIIDQGNQNIAVETISQWNEQREYFKKQIKHILSGTFPPPPNDIAIEVLDEHINKYGVKTEMVELRFGPNNQASLTLEVFTPPGDGPFPVFMTQWNHRGWAQIAVRRGYIGVVYAGADAKDDTRSYLELYPDYDWSTLMTRAWGAHRAVDYLYTKNEVDTSKIAITGHSRNGKQSLFAAAFDDRITAVISSSGGTGGEFPYRYTDERHSNESIEYLLSRRTHWFHPRLRFFWGREHKLPIDQNSLMALVAPNSLLLSSSIREGGGGDPWAIEQIYHSVSQVYDFLDVPDKVGLYLRDGLHAVSQRDIEAFVDWLDIRFERKNSTWENELFYDYSFDDWKSLSGETISFDDFPAVPPNKSLLDDNAGRKIGGEKGWIEKKLAIKEDIKWMLGDEPPGIAASPIEGLSQKEDYVSSFIQRPKVSNGKKENIAPYNALGDYLYGSLYYPTDTAGKIKADKDGKVPVVIYTHKFSNTGYDSKLNSLFEDFLSRGIAVFAMDMIGYGTRIEEGTQFYERYPNWSKLGKMVTDTRAAVDALEDIEFINSDKIFVAGYSLGGSVSLLTAAMDSRIAGAAVSSSFTPLRDAQGNQDNEGIKKYSHLYGLLPRLGFFIGEEDRLPIDFKEIIASIAPKPLLVITPELDRHANSKQVKETMNEVGTVYSLLDASRNLDFRMPHEFNHFTTAQQNEMVDWIAEKVQTD